MTEHSASNGRTVTKVVAISGSLRPGSTNTMLLGAASHADVDGIAITLWDGLAAVPPFTDENGASPPAAVHAMRREIAAADALLIATPELNYSVPGQLKNAIDWASHPIEESVFAGKPVAVIGASADPNSEALFARDDLRRILRVVGARVVGRDLLVLRADRAFSADGTLREAAHREALAGILRDIQAAASVTDRADELREIFDRIDRTWDFAPLIERLADDVSFRVTIPDGTPMSGEFRGKEAVTEYFIRTLPEIAQFKQQVPMEYIPDGDRVIILGDDAYTLTKTGETFRSPYAMVVRFSGDLIDDILIIQDLTGVYNAYR